jgi:hypothetical protein
VSPIRSSKKVPVRLDVMARNAVNTMHTKKRDICVQRLSIRVVLQQ